MRFNYSRPRKKTEIFDKPVTSVLIGRNWPLKERVDIDLAPDEEVARPHARLTLENGKYWIKDLGSETGTWTKGYRIKIKTQLEAGDHVWIGRWVFEIEPGAGAEVLVAPTLDEELSQTQKRLRAFYELSQALGAINPPGTLLEILAGKLREVIPMARRGANLEQLSINPSVTQSDKTRALKEMDRINEVLAELKEYEDEVHYPLVMKQLELDLNDSVKVNYAKFGVALRKISGL